MLNRERRRATTPPTYRLSDAQWQQIQGFLPANGGRGGQWKDHRLWIDGILGALSDGGRWRNLPPPFGPWQTVDDRFRTGCRTGLGDKILRHLQARKMRGDPIDGERFRSDGSVIRAHQSAAGAAEKIPPDGEPEDPALGRSQGGCGTELHLVCDGEGTPLAVAAGPG